ncbi:MAG: GyrI-like domain-containing protein [Actinomycetota bacterium]|nr:GyrI-like domain-containing protein [Actinomycetota bacterium]
MANSPLLPPDDLAAALDARRHAIEARRVDIARARATQEPLEPFVAAIFTHSELALGAELAWIGQTLASLAPASTPTAREDTMDTYDIKRAFPTLYAPKRGDFHVVEVPELSFLMTDGHGDPNVSSAYAEAVEALFSLSYAVRAVAKSELGRVHTVGPLEGLWSAEDPRAFVAGNKSAWNWTMMISQPAWITPEIIETAMKKTNKKALAALDRVRFAPYTEGTSVQVLHLGSYDSETSVLARLHDEYLPKHGLTFNGKHHEVYLSDPRRTEPAKLRTILRQPVASVS